jgi:hypothetical protein
MARTGSQDFDNKIVPHRYIPFDLGMEINKECTESMSDYFRGNHYIVEDIPGLLQSLSSDVIFKVKINEEIRLYIFSYGIGVFMVKDTAYPLNEKYAVGYCQYRKDSHKELLEFKREGISPIIEKNIDNLRKLVGGRKNAARPSANKNWEYGGLSYVMTVSYIIKKNKGRNDYEKFTEIDKKNLQIMLQPSLAHKEDTMAMSEIGENTVEFDPYNFQVENVTEPKNWINSEDCAIYISWAAVVIYMHDYIEKYMEIMEYLEVDLQAMWLYTYCQYLNLKRKCTSEKLTSARLKKDKYNFQRKYNEFISDNDSSIPVYIYEIRTELINTSGIEKEKDNFMAYIDYCIDESESKEREQQRKYAVGNEILLFIIAFIQIAPMLYNVLIGEYKDLEVGPIVVMCFIVVAAIFLIVRKD